jgi:ribosomal protein S18 acetylase RimI-like enzyme
MVKIRRICRALCTVGSNALRGFKGVSAAGCDLQAKPPADKAPLQGLSWRQELTALDAERIGRLVDLTGFFHSEEVAVAEELVQERLSKGDAGGYHFLMAEQHGQLAGYTCYGPIPCTRNSFDLYWIAVHPDFQRKGLGRKLMAETETLIRKIDGRRIYVETSQRNQYAGTRSFYESCGYHLESVLEDFYAPHDGKAIYCKVL